MMAARMVARVERVGAAAAAKVSAAARTLAAARATMPPKARESRAMTVATAVATIWAMAVTATTAMVAAGTPMAAVLWEAALVTHRIRTPATTTATEEVATWDLATRATATK